MATEIPVIDIAPFRADGGEAASAVARAVDEACRSIGFLVIGGHGVSASSIADMERVTRAFFALPRWEKARLRMPPDRYRGYMPVGSEDVAYSMGGPTNPPDWRECFASGPHDHAYDEYHHGPAGARYFAPNVWPDRPVDMRRTWEAYYGEMERLAATLMRLFAVALGIDERFFDDKIDRHITNFSASFYPAQKAAPEPGQLRCGAHTDYGSLTIVHCDTGVGGLEVCGKDGAWRPVPYVPGTFVVNLGDLMADWTNDRWRSTVHRVANPSRDQAAATRLSLLFFHQPNYDAVIECIPSCTGPDNPPKYAPITSGEHITRKLDMSRAPLLADAAAE